MTPAEFRIVLDRLGLTQRGLSRLFEINERTVRSWASGRIEIPAPIRIFLRFLVRADVTPEELHELTEHPLTPEELHELTEHPLTPEELEQLREDDDVSDQ
jgi:NAD-dependent oxidoreductase involved in siderophore biosynthesis